jgi:hypothetical protein
MSIADVVGPVVGSGIGILLILMVLAVSVGGFILWLWALIDSITRPDWAYQRAGSNKVLWILLNILVPFPCSLIYLFAVRGGLRDAQSTFYTSVGSSGGGMVGGFGPPARFCGRCGWPVSPSNAFCGNCGQAIAQLP